MTCPGCGAPDGQGCRKDCLELGSPAVVVANQPCEYRKCDGLGIICPTLADRLGDGYRRGLGTLLMIDTVTLEELTPILVYKKSVKDRGIVLNFCPFCGSELNRQYRPSLQGAVDQQQAESKEDL